MVDGSPSTINYNILKVGNLVLLTIPAEDLVPAFLPDIHIPEQSYIGIIRGFRWWDEDNRNAAVKSGRWKEAPQVEYLPVFADRKQVILDRYIGAKPLYLKLDYVVRSYQYTPKMFKLLYF